MRRLLPLALLETASAASIGGNALVTIALPWLVLERTDSPAAAGVVAAGATLPVLVGAVFAGTVVDLFGRRRTAVASDLVSGLSLLAIPVLDATVGFSVVWLTVCAALGAVFDLAGVTARKTMLPGAAEGAGWRLEQANGVHESVRGLAMMAGPGLGGLLIALGGGTAALAGAAAASLLAAAAQMALPLGRGAGGPRTQGTVRAVLSGAADGVTTVFRDRLLRVVALLGAFLYMFYLPIADLVLPAYFHDLGSPQRLGLLTVAMMAGGIAGAVVYGAAGHRMSRRLLFRISTTGAAAALFAMAWLPPYPVMVVLAVLVGMAYGPISPLMNLATQLRSREDNRGRVMGIMTSSGYVAGPVGYLAGGPLVQALGPATSFLALAGVLVVLVALASLLPGLREFDELATPARTPS